MRVTVYTSNQPRHRALVQKLSEVADELFVISETTTLFHGNIADFYPESPIMHNYFSRVMKHEANIFGSTAFLPKNATVLPLRMGDLSSIPLTTLSRALDSEIHIVFGASYIRGNLVDELINSRAINIHMGISPFYRGSSTNFWAAYDGRYDLVGATLHLLSKGLDSGDILYHALPKSQAVDSMHLGMLAVESALDSLVQKIADRSIFTLEPMPQDTSQQIRYTRNREFTEDVAAEYLARLPNGDAVFESLNKRALERFVRPVVI